MKKILISIFFPAFFSCLAVENSPYDTARGGMAGFLMIDALATGKAGSNRVRFLAATDAPALLESYGDGQWTEVATTGATTFQKLATNGSKIFGISTDLDTYFMSDDFGRTWISKSVPLGGGSPIRIASCGQKLVLTAGGGGNFRATMSLDGGQTWNGPTDILPGFTPSADLAHCPVTPQGACADFCTISGSGGGTHHTVYSNDGITWTPVVGNPALPAQMRHGMASGAQGMVFGTGTGAIYHSSNDPANFNQVDTELSYSGHVMHTGQNFMTVAQPGTIVRLRYSSNPSAGWQQNDVDFVSDPPTINSATAQSGMSNLVGNRSGNPFVMRSTDHGITWQVDNLPAAGTSISSVISLSGP